MDDKQRVQACLASLFLLPAAAWFLTAKLVYGFTPQTVRSQLGYLAGNTFNLWPLWVALLGSFIVGIALCIIIAKYGKMTFAGAAFKKFYRGSQLISQAELARLTNDGGTQITIAGVPIPRSAETTHFSIGGSTATGKSTIFKEMMLGCLKRGDRMVILDPDGEFLSTFYRPGDKILNPYDARTEGWSFYNEIRDDFDFERYAKSIIQKSGSADSEEWNKYGRLLFHEVARKLYNTQRNPNIRDVFNWTNERDQEELEEFVKGTKAVSLFTGNERATGSVRFVLSDKLSPHLKMPNGSFSLRDWIDDPKGGNLFITWDENMKEALRPLISCWVDTIFSTVLGLKASNKRRIWTYLDELESLDHLPTLGDALTKGRKKGLCVVSGYQTYTQVVDVYGENLAETMLSNHRTMVALAVGRMGTKTAEKMATALGEHEVERMKEGRSQRFGQMGTKSENEDIRPEKIVMASEIMALPNLEGFLSYPGNLPIARIKIEPIQFKRSKPVPGIVPLSSALGA